MSTMNHEIYIASPLFCEEDHAGLDLIEEMLDLAGVSYFSPRRDSNLNLSEAKTPEEKDAMAQKIFDLNKEAVASSKLVIVNTIGTRWNNAIYGDMGTMVEAGLAFAQNIPVVTYNFKKYGLNIMLSQEVVYHCDDTTPDGYEELNKIVDVLDRINELGEGNSSPQQLRKEFFLINDRELV